MSIRKTILNYSNKRLNALRIIEVVSQQTGFTHEDMRDNSRRQNLVEARYVAMYLIRKHTDLSLGNIGKLFSRDHSSVIHGIWNVKTFVEVDERFREKLEACEHLLPKQGIPIRNSGISHWVALGLEWNNFKK